MAVEIELELDASSALGEIGAVSLALENLDQKFDDLDGIDFGGSIGEVAEDLNELLDALDEIEAKVDNLGAELSQAAQEWDDVEIGFDEPDGSTGGGPGGENDPPDDGGGDDSTTGTSSKGFTVELSGVREMIDEDEFPDSFDSTQITNEIEDAFDLEGGSISEAAVEGMDQGELNEAMADVLHDVRGHDYRTQNLGSAAISDDELFGRGGRIDPDLDVDFKDQFRDELLSVDIGSAMNLDLDGREWLGHKMRNFDFGSLNDGMARFRKNLRRLKPSMSQYLNLLAALLPMMVAFGVQAAGVAAALGGRRITKKGVLGLGLLGHAQSMSGAMQQAKQEVREFKAELFDTFQPTMMEFAPIQSKFFDWAPEQLEGVAEAMEGLTAYEGTFYDLFNIGVRAAEELVNVLVQNEEIISAMATEAAGLIASGLVRFFRWLIQTAYENWSLMMDLGAVFIQLAQIAYNVSMAIGRIIAALRPLFAALAGLSNLLQNDLVMGLLTFIAVSSMIAYSVGKTIMVIWGLYSALTAVAQMLAFIGGGSILAGITTFFSTLWSYITATIIALYEMSTAAAIAATALAATGVGALVVGAGVAAGGVMSSMATKGPSGGGGYGGPGPSRMGGGKEVVYNDQRTYEINNNGGMDNASEQRIRDVVKETNGTKTSMNPPSPGTGSSQSNSDEGGNGGGS